MERCPSEANRLSPTQQISAFYGNRKFITAFTRTAICPYPETYHFSPCPPIPLLEDTFYYYTSSMLRSSKGTLSPSYLTKTQYATLTFPHVLYAPNISFFRSDHMKNIWCGVEVIKLLIMYFSQVLCYLVPPRPKYAPRHPILKHRQPKFLLSYERPIFTPKLNIRLNYISVYLNLLIFR